MAKDFNPENVVVSAGYFCPVLLSHCLTPFNVNRLPLALIPVQKDSSGEWSEMGESDRKFLPRPLEHLFSSIYDKYRTEKKGKDLFSTGLNMRNKLSSQQLQVGQFIVVYGAGGSRTCAAYFKMEEEIKRLVIDQTIYYYTSDSEEEALYLTGMLNSPAVGNANAVYQSQGIFGRRHIHTLPSTSIPEYNPNDPLHEEIVSVTCKLRYELGKKVSSDLFDPNYGTVSIRRSKIYKILDGMEEFRKINDIAFRILTAYGNR